MNYMNIIETEYKYNDNNACIYSIEIDDTIGTVSHHRKKTKMINTYNLHGQQIKTEIHTKIYFGCEGGTIDIIEEKNDTWDYFYNCDGYLEKAIHKQITIIPWSDEISWILLYDKHGNIVSESSIDGEFSTYCTHEYEYDENNRIIKVVNPMFIREIKYDDNGNELSSKYIYKEASLDADTLDEIYYSYNDNNQIINAMNIHTCSNGMKNINIFNYEYCNNKCVHEYKDIYNSDDKCCDDKIYEYDEKGNLIHTYQFVLCIE